MSYVKVFRDLYFHTMSCPSFHPVPEPDVEVTANCTSTLYAGTGLTLTCTVTPDSNVDSIMRVITWSGPRSIPGARYSITGSGTSDISNLTISPLAEDEDSGMYSCTVVVTGGNYVVEATASDEYTISGIRKE